MILEFREFSVQLHLLQAKIGAGRLILWIFHVYYEYKADGVDNLDAIEFKYNKNFKNIFDLYLNNSCTEPSMVGSKNVEESMAEFAMGNVAMIQNGNWGWAMIYDLDGNVVKRKILSSFNLYRSRRRKPGTLCRNRKLYLYQQ